MLKVIKKGGKEVDFISDKIKTSIANSGNDINFILNQIDLDLIVSDIEKRIIKVRGKDGKTSSYEIISLVLEALHNMSFKKVADSYYRGSFSKMIAK